jgi:ADP-ribose pyrophosphatase YjhB (NUDIX family)
LSTEDYPKVRVAVALVLDDAKQAFLWTWNPHWKCFALPMSKVHPWLGVRGANVEAAAREAAERAGAEALGVPTVVHHARSLEPVLERSGRDGRLKSYKYEAFRAGPHDRYADRLDIRAPHLWLAGHEALSGEFRPLAASSVKVIGQLAEANLVPDRLQMASTVLLSRGPDEAPEFLMHPNPDWGYAFPSKRREHGESAQDAAARVVTEELGLRPGVTVTLRAAPDGPVAYRARSASAGVDTSYFQFPFWATLHNGASLDSKRSLAWVPLIDIVNGSTAGPPTVAGTVGAPGQVSRTARQILERLRYF